MKRQKLIRSFSSLLLAITILLSLPGGLISFDTALASAASQEGFLKTSGNSLDKDRFAGLQRASVSLAAGVWVPAGPPSPETEDPDASDPGEPGSQTGDLPAQLNGAAQDPGGEGTVPDSTPAVQEGATAEPGALAPAVVEAILSCSAPIRIMPVGDSITAGKSSGAPNDTDDEWDTRYWISYRKKLWDDLKAKNYAIDYVGSQDGGSIYSGFDTDHEGHGGWTDGEVAINIYGWLTDNPADILLLHIGTNQVNTSTAEVKKILDEVDRWERDNNTVVWVVVARIINRSCSVDDPPCAGAATTTQFNKNVEAMVDSRTSAGDKLKKVNMETGAGINYHLRSAGGNMHDDLHPYATGYTKMAVEWRDLLTDQLLPWCARDDSVSSTEGSGKKTFAVLGNDTADNSSPQDMLKIVGATGGDAGGTVTVTPDQESVEYTPAPDFSGDEHFTYMIQGGGPAGSDYEGRVTVSVADVNDPPLAVADTDLPIQFLEDTPVTFPGSDLTVNDSPGPFSESVQSLFVDSVTNTPDTHGSVILNGTDLTYTPDQDYYGPASFQYTVCDSGNPRLCDPNGVVSLSVAPVNDPPTASDDTFTVAANSQSNVLNVLANDTIAPDANETLAIVSVGDGSGVGPKGGKITITLDGKFLVYIPKQNFSGSESFIYTIIDDSGSIDTALITVNVGAVPPAKPKTIFLPVVIKR